MTDTCCCCGEYVGEGKQVCNVCVSATNSLVEDRISALEKKVATLERQLTEQPKT